MANRFVDPRAQFVDSTGAPYAGGFLYFYETGTTTETDTYSDSTLTTPNTNPVVLDSAGRLPNDVFLDPNVTYKVVLQDADSVAVWTADPVDDPAANVTAAFQVFAGNPNGNLAGSAGTAGGSGSSVCWDITNNLLYVCTTSGDEDTAVWTQVGATLSGGVQITGVISPTALAADQNNYSPTGNAAASAIRQDLSANVSLTGLAGGATGFLKVITNISSAYALTLVDGAISTSSTAANRFDFGGYNVILYPGQSISLQYDGTSSRWRPRTTFPMPAGIVPGGRLTLETAVPISTSDQTAKTTVYYTPYLHGYVPLYNGSSWYVAPFSEVSQTLADNTKSPAAAAVTSVYDLFIWNDAGTIRLSRGPAWSSATARGTGAGTTELERVNGRYVNKVAITNGPAAQRGLYVGTIHTNGSGANGQLDMMFSPAAAAGGSSNRLLVWNMYNRVDVSALCRDSTDSWNYSTATFRAANNSNSNRITFVLGLNEDAIDATYTSLSESSGGSRDRVGGVGLDSTSAFVGTPSLVTGGASQNFSGVAHYRGLAGLGVHYVQALEYGESGDTNTWYGDAGSAAFFQTGLSLRVMM